MTNNRGKIKKTQGLSQEEDSDHQLAEFIALVCSNEDLLIEILLRLPATSILRFKSVSKRWNWLLSQRSFTLQFDKLSKSRGMFAGDKYVPFDVEDQSPPPFRSLDFHPDIYGIKILQFCNGLLLCSSDRCPRDARKYYVFNPTTKQFAIIPPVPGGETVHETIRFMGLAFHQTDCVHYKVICIRALLKPVGDVGDLYQIQVYSSDTGEWKISMESFYVHKAKFESWFNQPTFRNGVYWNGAFHWFPSLRDNLYFKIDVEQLQSLALPGEKTFKYIGESRGHLHLIGEKYRGPHSLHLNVYEMLSSHSGWFVKYQLELDELLRAFPGMINPFGGFTFEVVDVVRGEKDEDTFLVLVVPAGLLTSVIKYNVHDSSFKEIFTLPNKYYDGLPTFHRYTETLTSF